MPSEMLHTDNGVFDPSRPVPALRARPSAAIAASRQSQRRAQILATIRQLLVEEGFGGVTVRRIASVSGHAVQTIYNLIGPRDQAIVEAISEYTRYVGRTARRDPADPGAMLEIIHRWMLSVEASPQFCRQVNLIFFSDLRGVFYVIRDRQRKAMLGLLSRQQKSGVLRADANIPDLADQLVLLTSALCVEWSDRPFSIERLHRLLGSGYANLLDAAISPGSRRQWMSTRDRLHFGD